MADAEPTRHAEKDRQEEALLGLATTRQLLEELAIRFEITNPHRHARGMVLELLRALPAHVLNYRTVDS